MRKRKSDVFGKEKDILNHVQEVNQKSDVTREELVEEYDHLASQYERLLKEVKMLTSVSDRLHIKLDDANQQLSEQANNIQEINLELRGRNEELNRTLDQLLKAKVGNKALTIVLLIAIVLFLITEGWIEPILEESTDNNYVGLFLKGIVALTLKPIDTLVERFLMKRAIKDNMSKVATSN